MEDAHVIAEAFHRIAVAIDADELPHDADVALAMEWLEGFVASGDDGRSDERSSTS